jgi:6-pyruvoyltetrahydropterin/6-carboxytetrahydropterin synthase
MYYLTVSSHFDAAHALVGYDGPCSNLHGHTWTIDVTVRGTELDHVGIVYDFKALKRDLADLLEPLDHHFLNEVPPFDRMNSTAENMSRWLYQSLAKRIAGKGVEVVEVSVWESPIAKVTYREE